MDAMQVREAVTEPNPDDWPLGFFPEPNPYFPAPPRSDARRPIWWSAVLSASSVAGFTGLRTMFGDDGRYSEDQATFLGYVIVQILSGLFGLCALIAGIVWLVRFFNRRQSEAWHAGRIIPARTVASDASLPVTLLYWAFMGALMLMSHGLHFVLEVIRGDGHAPLIEYVDRGKWKRRRMTHCEIPLRPGQYMWIAVVPWPWTSALIHEYSDSELRKTPIPDNVCAWLDASLREAKQGALLPPHCQYSRIGT